MSLSISGRTIGDVNVLKCGGRIVEGAATTALRQRVNDVLSHTPAVVLDLSEVQFIDSGGLGMLVRVLARAGQENLKLCGLTSRVSDTLKVTRLSAVFDCHPTEAEAIAAFYRAPAGASRPAPFVAPNVLCVVQSAELLTFMQEVLRQAGLSVATTSNLPDAVTLLKAMTPQVVLVDPELRSAGTIGIVDSFNRLVGAAAVVDLPPDLARQDPLESGPRLVERVRILMAGVT